MSRFSRRWSPFLGGAVAAIVLVITFALLFTQTAQGRDRILGITLRTLGGQVNGVLAIDRLEGGLFTGARFYGLSLNDPSGESMVVADSAYIRYRLPTFFGGDIVINNLTLYGADLLIYRLPGDSLWNYQALLQDTTPEVPGQRGRATILRELDLVDARVTVRVPWEPEEDLPAAEREAEIDAALSDTSRIAVEAVPGGYLRTILIRAERADLEALTVAPDERGGTYLRIVDAVADVGLYRDIPLQIRGLQGELSLREGIVRYDAPRVTTPASQVATAGMLDLTGDAPVYDIGVSGTGVALRDARWLYPRFPEEGQASFAMVVETRPETLFLRAADLELRAPGTRLAGDFTLLMGDTLLFSDVSVRADPLDMQTVQGMLPTTIPVRGLQIGTVEIETPAS